MSRATIALALVALAACAHAQDSALNSLPAATSVNDTDILYIEQPAGVTAKKVEAATLITFGGVKVDLGDNGSDEINRLLRINTSGDTSSIFTECVTDELCFNVSNAWPTCTALAVDPTACGAGDFVRDIAANGTLTCATPAGSGDGVGYDEVLDEATGLTKRAKVNFTGAGVSCVDNAGAVRTDCTIAGGGVTDHGALTGLADDDHPHYALLAGRAGGQTLIGGTGILESLLAYATSGTTTSGALYLSPTQSCLFADRTFVDTSSLCTNLLGTAVSLNSADSFAVTSAAGQVVTVDTDGTVGTDTKLRVGDSDSNLNSACIANSADRLYHDTDCDNTKDAGEQFIDQVGVSDGSKGDITVSGSGAVWTYSGAFPLSLLQDSTTADLCLLSGGIPSDPYWATCPSGGSGITVEAVDGTPSYPSSTTVRFDEADGFVLSTPGAGIARLDFTPPASLYALYTITTGSGTYNLPAGVTSIIVEIVGGGGGGGAGSSSTTSCGTGGGGGGGGYSVVSLTSPASSYSYSVGAAGGSAANGGNTSFGTYTANGGLAGGACNSCSTAAGSSGGAGGTGSGAGTISGGDAGSGGFCIDLSTALACSGGSGGGSVFGGGGAGASRVTTGTGNGSSANNYGGGGGGGCGTNTNSTQIGGSGSGGLVRVWEFVH